MIKNKIKIILLIVFLMFSFLSPVVSAENETTNETTNEQTNSITETQEKFTIKDDDEYVFAQNVTIDNPIDGNLFVFANHVTINSQIGGDAFIFADTIDIEEDGYILSNLFACSTNINVKGSVYNIYSLSNNMTINGFVHRDIRSACNSLNINGMIGRNAFVNSSNINFKEKPETEENANVTSYGTIQGNLTYYSDEEIAIPAESVAGNVNFNSLKREINISSYIYSLGALIVSAIIIWLLGLWLSPKFLHITTQPLTVKKALQIIGLGILVPLIISLLSILIVLIPITSQFAIFLLCILAILFFISTSITIINISNSVCHKLKITKNIHTLGFLIITAFVFWLLTLIPYIGAIISFISIIWGIGSISYTILKKDEKIKEETK